jgi:ribonuclease HI
MEILAVLTGLRRLPNNIEVEIYSDSKYVVDGCNKWLDKWAQKQFRKVKNPDLWIQLYKVIKDHKGKITFNWVKAHSINKYNNLADKLARDAASGSKLIEDEYYIKYLK